MNSDPPGLQQFEFSLFGPGSGECLVVHYGHGKWFVVDSSVQNGEPIALSYLKGLGVDVHSDVTHIFATHFDDDHCNGLDTLLMNCDNAKMHCSSALFCKEFFECLVKNSKLKLVQAKPGLKVFGDILEHLRSTSPIPSRCRSKFGPEKLQAKISLHLSDDVSISVLSPSSVTIEDSAEQFRMQYLETGSSVTATPNNWFNMSSIAMIVETAKVNLLLGADLEEGSNNYVGWRGVINDTDLRKRKSKIFKIPHHGSVTAEYQPVWDELVESSPELVLTSKAQSGIPKKEDVQRLKGKNPNSLTITNPNYLKKAKKHGAANRQMNQKTRKRKLIRKGLGQVRLLFDLGDENIKIETYGLAKVL